MPSYLLHIHELLCIHAVSKHILRLTRDIYARSRTVHSTKLKIAYRQPTRHTHHASVAFAVCFFLLQYSRSRMKNKIACLNTFSVRQIVINTSIHTHTQRAHTDRRVKWRSIYYYAVLHSTIKYDTIDWWRCYLYCAINFKLINMELLLLDLRMSKTLKYSVQYKEQMYRLETQNPTFHS